MLGPDLFKEHLLTKLGHTFLAWLHKRTKKLTQKCQIWLLTNFGQPVKIALAQICKHNACSFCRFKMVLNLAKYQDLNKTFLTWFKRQNYVINIIFWSSHKIVWFTPKIGLVRNHFGPMHWRNLVRSSCIESRRIEV